MKSGDVSSATHKALTLLQNGRSASLSMIKI